MVLEDLGGIIFFTDPLTAHPHADDIATLLRMADMNNGRHATNPTTALALVPVLDAVARATGGPAFEGTVACAVEPANRGRDAHCSLHLEGVVAGGGGAFAALLDLRGAALDGARVRAAACLAAELAGLAGDVACSSSPGT